MNCRHQTTQYLECLLAGVSAGHEVVSDSDEPVTVAVPLIEAVGGTDEDPAGQYGGRAHEVSLATALPQEERGEPRETSLGR